MQGGAVDCSAQSFSAQYVILNKALACTEGLSSVNTGTAGLEGSAFPRGALEKSLL